MTPFHDLVIQWLDAMIEELKNIRSIRMDIGFRVSWEWDIGKDGYAD